MADFRTAQQPTTPVFLTLYTRKDMVREKLPGYLFGALQRHNTKH